MRLIGTVNYLLPLLLCERTVFIIAGNMCSKDLDKQYTLNIVFLFCTALFFILMLLLQMYYIFLPFMVYKTKMLLPVFHCHTILIENVCILLRKSMLSTSFIKMCVKYIFPNPLCLEFFWYSPYSGKETGSALYVLHQAMKIKVT